MVNITPATDIWNTTSFVTFISNVDSASGNLFVLTMIAGTFLITMFMMKNFDTKTTFLSASFTTACVGFLLAYAGVGLSYTVPTYVLLVAAIIFYMID